MNSNDQFGFDIPARRYHWQCQWEPYCRYLTFLNTEFQHEYPNVFDYPECAHSLVR